jgi:hypothetical protein
MTETRGCCVEGKIVFVISGLPMNFDPETTIDRVCVAGWPCVEVNSTATILRVAADTYPPAVPGMPSHIERIPGTLRYRPPPQVLFSLAQVDAVEPVSCSTAHDWLKHLRQVMRQVTHYDMSHDPRYNWRGYLANRPRWEGPNSQEFVIGPGVQSFCFRWLPKIDPNTGDNRADFIVERVDGLSIRLHPQSSVNPRTKRREAIAVALDYQRL